MRISGQRGTKRTTTIVVQGIGSWRTTSWPTIRSRRMHLWVALRPDEAENLRRFQVRTCVWFLRIYYNQNCNVTVLLYCSFGMASKQQRVMHQGTPWGLMIICSSGLSKWYGQEVGVRTFQTLVWLQWAAILRPKAWMTIVCLASVDSVFSSLIEESRFSE